MDEDDGEFEGTGPSKSARKREMLGYQALAEDLVRLPPAQLARIDMPAELRDGVLAARRLQRWRERLLSEGDAAVEAFIEAHPSVDRQRLRSLVRAASRGAERLRAAEESGAPTDSPASQARRTATALFRFLRDCDESA